MPLYFPNFNSEKATQFVLEFEDPLIRDFVRLLYLRDIEGVAISDDRFLHHQDRLLPYLQEALGSWLIRNRRSLLSYGEALAFLGYLGLNGTVIPSLVEAVEYAFGHFPRKEGAFLSKSGRINKCGNMSLLRAILAMGFAEHSQVQQICYDYLHFIEGQEGKCHVRTDGNPCAYVLVKTLRWLNEFPRRWRTKTYQQIVTNIQQYLLSYNLSKADYPRRGPDPNKNWFRFGYFRSYQSSIFEVTEALILSGIKDDLQLQTALNRIGAECIDGVTWKPQYIQKSWPLALETKKQGSPWLTLRGLRIAKALKV